MAKVIAFVSPKGGCGSTFLCAGLWHAFTQNSHRVLALDMCFDKGTLDFALGFQNDYIYTLEDVLCGRIEFSDALCRYGETDGFFLRGAYSDTTFDVGKLREYFKEFDYVLLDISSDKDAVRNILPVLDALVCVTDLGCVSVKLCDDFLSDLDFERTYIAVNKIVPTYCQSGIHLTVDEALDILGCQLLGLVPWTPDAEIMLRQGMKLGISDKSVSASFGNIMCRLKGDRVKAIDFKKVYDCFKINKNFRIKID